MQKVRIVAVGKVKESYLREAVAEYSKRLSRFCGLELLEIPDSPDNAQAIDREGALILPKLTGTVYPLCVDGAETDSLEFAALIRDVPIVTFVIGGSRGLADDVVARGRKISLSRLTFPHQVARVILLEQIYRGFKIINNETYHK